MIVKGENRNPSDTELAVMVRAALAQSIARATQPVWRIVVVPMVLGVAFTLAMMVLVTWLIKSGLL